jgi:1-acyl-sn-glycerol-3-phosphate acyltransferase
MLLVALAVVCFFAQAVLLKRYLPRPLERVNATVCWLTIVATAAFPCLLLVVPYFTLRLFSESLYLRFTCWCQFYFLQMWLLMIVVYSEVHIKTYGDSIDTSATTLWIMNHVSHDWIAIYWIMLVSRALATVRTIIKGSVSYIPFLGWSMVMAYWPFLARKYEQDVIELNRCFAAYREARVPLHVWLFPEGTRPAPDKVAESRTYAEAHGKPVWDNVMLPRHRGFDASVDALRLCGAATLADCTLAYDGFRNDRHWALTELLFGDYVAAAKRPRTVHVHVRRVPLASIPSEAEGRKEWLMNAFQAKDELLAQYWQSPAEARGFGRSGLIAHHTPDKQSASIIALSLAYLFVAWWCLPVAFQLAWTGTSALVTRWL